MRFDHERCFPEDSEHEHYGKLADSCGSSGKAISQESAEVDRLPAVGTYGRQASLPRFVRKRLQPDSQQRDDSPRYRDRTEARDPFRDRACQPGGQSDHCRFLDACSGREREPAASRRAGRVDHLNCRRDGHARLRPIQLSETEKNRLRLYAVEGSHRGL